jgi:hypothetical protein
VRRDPVWWEAHETSVRFSPTWNALVRDVVEKHLLGGDAVAGSERPLAAAR